MVRQPSMIVDTNSSGYKKAEGIRCKEKARFGIMSKKTMTGLGI